MAEVKKVHWTQTPEGKAKMAAAQKKAWASRRAKKPGKTKRPYKRGTPTDADRKRWRRNEHLSRTMNGKLLPRQEIIDLARAQARSEISQLEKRIIKLRLFIGEEN